VCYQQVPFPANHNITYVQELTNLSELTMFLVNRGSKPFGFGLEDDVLCCKISLCPRNTKTAPISLS
jgi:hypothetical protein